MADARIAESLETLWRFVTEHGSLLTVESWTEAAMRPSEKTIRRRFGSFREAIQRADFLKEYLAARAEEERAAWFREDRRLCLGACDAAREPQGPGDPEEHP
ncbi:MAG TPA: hypothetical protein VLR46_14580 [Candidatus Dormibacteraeota bacterium]|nr:hypothetical protein [Candidatus Dormibacteraeota bacterium]